ncbi:MAG: hypothetical protein ACRDTS_00375 [Mycobacterium sp.]
MDISRHVRGIMRDDPRLLIEAEQKFAQLRMERGFHHDGRPYPVSLEPLLIDQSHAVAAQKAAEDLHRVLEHVADLYRMDETVRKFMRRYRNAEPWLCMEPSVKPYVGVCRFDGVIIDGTYRVMETNTCCPGGVIKVPAQFPLWRTVITTVLGGPALESGEQPFIANPTLFVQHLLQMYRRQFNDTPLSAAIVNLNGRYTNEVNLMTAGLEEFGVAVRVVDATCVRRAAEGGIRVDDLKIGLTYNKLDQLELISTPECFDYLEAAAAGELCFQNSLMAQLILEDKAVLALMSDPTFSDMFDTNDNEVIRRHVPWTRLMTPGRTTSPECEPVELAKFVIELRDRLVLKPRNLTRGEGILIGPKTSRKVWENTVGMAIRNGSHVVQEYLPLPSIDLVGGNPPHLRQMSHELDTYLFDGRFVGFMCRASLDPIVNVGRGGTMVPVVVTE